MNWFRMFFQITFSRTYIITNWAFIRLFVLMNWIKTYFQVGSLRKTKIANWAHICMTFCSHELIQYAFLTYLFENNWNHKLNTSVTYWFSMIFLRTNLITNWALAWLFVLTNWFKMYFHVSFWEKWKLQIELLYDFLFSWTNPICILKLTFLRIAEVTNWIHL